MYSRLVRLVLAATLGFASGARAQSEPDSGAISCTDSGDCAHPTPYCDEARHACVECLSDQNCIESTGLCDEAAGVCVPCLTDLDCGAPTPYCSDDLDRCLECRVDANCGDGTTCLDGVCGECGDGICGRRERLYTDYVEDGESILCIEDCAALCPERDVGESVGRNLIEVETSDLRNLFTTCSQGAGPDTTFTWTAPTAGYYVLDTAGSTVPTLIAFTSEECSSANFGCTTGSSTVHQLMDGDTLTFVIDTFDDTPGTLVANLERCENCGDPIGPIDPPDDAGAEPPPATSAECLSNAAARGDSMCAGVECACAQCPDDYDDCGVADGCRDVLSCMQQHDCVGAECYISGACRAVTDSFGGVSGAAFLTASNLLACVEAFDCGWPCPTDAGEPPGVPDAGQLCEPGRVVVCECDGGAMGQRECLDDGNAFGACECGAEATDTAEPGDGGDAGCGCRVGRNTIPNSRWIASALVGLTVLRRTRRRKIA